MTYRKELEKLAEKTGATLIEDSLGYIERVLYRGVIYAPISFAEKVRGV